MICLFDEDLSLSMNFRCFTEHEVIPADIRTVPVIPNQNDDDCKTQEKEIEISSQYLAFQLENSIIKEPCNA